jgi:hypothetical protein
MKSQEELRHLDVDYLLHPTIILEAHERSGPRIIVDSRLFHRADGRARAAGG